MEKGLYARPNKPRTTAVRQRSEAPVVAPLAIPELVAVDRTTECHVTPPEVAARMVDYLDATNDMLTLEPQAGTGNLIAALLDAGHSQYELVAIERHYSLCRVIEKRFISPRVTDPSYRVNPIQECFLAYAERAKGKIEYPAVLCNPPFRAIKSHMNAAISLLGRGGHAHATLVGLVPITYQHPQAEEMEELPMDTFASATVRTKIIRIVI